MPRSKKSSDTPDPNCAYCGKPGDLSRDHVVPRSRGGPDNATNIVLACKSCNSSKGDQLASEWLGERCPQPVLLIEAKVNAKLKTVFSQRDRRKPAPPRLYAFHETPAGGVDYIGEVVSEGPDTLRLAVIGGFAFMVGFWDATGELRDVPKSECRIFYDQDACAEVAADRLNSRQRDK